MTTKQGVEFDRIINAPVPGLTLTLTPTLTLKSLGGELLHQSPRFLPVVTPASRTSAFYAQPNSHTVQADQFERPKYCYATTHHTKWKNRLKSTNNNIQVGRWKECPGRRQFDYTQTQTTKNPQHNKHIPSRQDGRTTTNHRQGFTDGSAAGLFGPKSIRPRVDSAAGMRTEKWLLAYKLKALIFLKRRQTTYGDQLFAVAGPRVWNSLPTELRQSDSLGQFKQRLKTHLFGL